MMDIKTLLEELGIQKNQKGCTQGNLWYGSGPEIISYSPVNDKEIGRLQGASPEDYESVIETATEAFEVFRNGLPQSEESLCVKWEISLEKRKVLWANWCHGKWVSPYKRAWAKYKK